MRNTRNWKHITKNRKQYKKIESDSCVISFNPYYNCLSEIGLDKRNTPFMDLTDLEDED